MAYALIADHEGGSPNTETVTTGAIDSTGANLLVGGVGKFSAARPGTFSDSKGNTWADDYSGEDGDGNQVGIGYSSPSSVGSSHTATYATDTGGVSVYPGLIFAAFSGAAESPVDGSPVSSTANGTSIQAGSKTPSEDNCLLIAILISQSDAAVSIDGGFTIIRQLPASASPQYRAAAVAYLIQTTAAAANPTWSWTGSHTASAIIHSFKAAPAPPTMEPRFLRPTQSNLRWR